MARGVPPELDEAALEELYTRLEKPLFNLAYRRLWDGDEARDAVQDAFVRLWRMRSRVRLESVEPLVYRITLNLLASRKRWKRVRRWLSLEAVRERPAAQPAADQQLEAGRRQAALRRAVESLPEDLRQVILLCEFSELRYQQVAELLGIPSGTVASRRHRALKLLRQQLETGWGDDA
jgi:RNA polymerase sigma-70 factor (ECF subfamily)